MNRNDVSQLTQQALETSEGLMKALDELQSMLLQFCAADKLAEMRVEFSDVRTRACQLKGYVAAACVCAGAPEPKTLRQLQAERQTEIPVVPAFPTHAVKPPPKHFHEGVNA